MWWWITVALAGPVRVQELPFQSFPVKGPEGVTSTLVNFPVPDGDPAVHFELDPAPALRDHHLVVRGQLRNDSDHAATVYLMDAPAGGGAFQVRLSGAGVTWKPVPLSGPPQPEVYPLARKLVVPPRASIPYECGVRLDQYRWPPGGSAVVDWSFALLPGVNGTLPVTLP